MFLVLPLIHIKVEVEYIHPAVLCADGEDVGESSDVDGSLNDDGDHASEHKGRLKNIGPHHGLQASLRATHQTLVSGQWSAHTAHCTVSAPK